MKTFELTFARFWEDDSDWKTHSLNPKSDDELLEFIKTKLDKGWYLVSMETTHTSAPTANEVEKE